jgi:hypothetical protein
MKQITERLKTSLAAVDAACAQSTVEHTDLHRATIRGLLRGYEARWANNHQFQTESVEQEFCQPIYNLKNKSDRLSISRTFRVAGKKDVIALGGRHDRWIVDHKTTSSNIEAPDAVFWGRLPIEGQANLYLLSEHISGKAVMGAVWDVIRKPGIRPKKLTKVDQKAITSLGEYYGYQVAEQTKHFVLANGDENTELYELRVAHECEQKPHRYFQRREILRLEHEMLEYAADLWDLAAEVRTCRQTRRHLRNSGNCLRYGTPCPYLGICSGYDTPESDKWRRRETVHAELSTLDGDGRDVLTNSRLACFQECRRKHYFRYELGIERQNTKPSDALFLGTIMHVGLAAWWSCFPIQPPIHGGV